MPVQAIRRVWRGTGSRMRARTYFPNTQAGYYWTSTPYTGVSSYIWTVQFSFGLASYTLMSFPSNVRCVR